MQAIKFSYAQVLTLSRSTDFRGVQRTSKAEALQKSVHLLLLSWSGLPDWTWIGQNTLSNQFQEVAFEPFLWQLRRGYQIFCLLHVSSCNFQEYHNPHLCRFLYHCVSFTTFQLVPVEEKPESSLSTFIFLISRETAIPSSLHRFSYFAVHSNSS